MQTSLSMKFVLPIWNYKQLQIFHTNFAEHEICPANMKLQTTANSFLLNIAEHKNSSINKYENANYCRHFHIY